VLGIRQFIKDGIVAKISDKMITAEPPNRIRANLY
jgi:hypothetical protein